MCMTDLTSEQRVVYAFLDDIREEFLELMEHTGTATYKEAPDLAYCDTFATTLRTKAVRFVALRFVACVALKLWARARFSRHMHSKHVYSVRQPHAHNVIDLCVDSIS